jgi:hypothetical protein
MLGRWMDMHRGEYTTARKSVPLLSYVRHPAQYPHFLHKKTQRMRDGRDPKAPAPREACRYSTRPAPKGILYISGL